MYCRNCGKQIDPNAAVCTGCGFLTGTGGNFCPNCGRPTTPGAAFCTSCGVGLMQQYSNQGFPGQKSKILAGLLGIFLGSLGVHNFYLGYTTRGIIQLVLEFLTCGISGVWGFIEGIMILVGSIKTDANGIPLKD